ncbi:hypothetical protein L596_015282 [Steinernema carpocapsae]|uniref:Uncharacterized protein n=1 Tax=Steinernema carpocapsae TaxID=34508 RepID=A0A4U5NFE6_STECR|nr:hypothetical protein L596_015282 [Steinernema carpocapsae]
MLKVEYSNGSRWQFEDRRHSTIVNYVCKTTPYRSLYVRTIKACKLEMFVLSDLLCTQKQFEEDSNVPVLTKQNEKKKFPERAASETSVLEERAEVKMKKKVRVAETPSLNEKVKEEDKSFVEQRAVFQNGRLVLFSVLFDKSSGNQTVNIFRESSLGILKLNVLRELMVIGPTLFAWVKTWGIFENV